MYAAFSSETRKQDLVTYVIPLKVRASYLQRWAKNSFSEQPLGTIYVHKDNEFVAPP